MQIDRQQKATTLGIPHPHLSLQQTLVHPLVNGIKPVSTYWQVPFSVTKAQSLKHSPWAVASPYTPGSLGPSPGACARPAAGPPSASQDEGPSPEGRARTVPPVSTLLALLQHPSSFPAPPEGRRARPARGEVDLVPLVKMVSLAAHSVTSH